MKIDQGVQKTIIHPENEKLKFEIRETEKFEKDLFSLPYWQKFPHNHYEVKFTITAGDIASGKSTLGKQYYGNKINDKWGENNVNRILAREIWATVEGIIYSKDQVHYVIIDDSVPAFDSRRSPSKNNVNVTQFFYEIRHELKEYSRESGNAGGLVFINLITQDFGAIDVRLRKSAPLIVFKTSDRVLNTPDYKFVEPKIKKALKKMKYKSSLVCDYFYRKLAVGIDCYEKYTMFFANADNLPYVKFRTVSGIDIFEQQKEDLMMYLVDMINLDDKNYYIRSKLREEIKKMKAKGVKVRVYESDFKEIIEDAKTYLEDRRRENEKLEEKIPSDNRTKEDILILHDTFGYTFREIGEKFRIPKSTANDWYHEARRKRLEHLKSLENDEN